MKPLVIALLLPLGVIAWPAGAPVAAGEAAIWRYNRHSQEPAFPLSERAQSVWASGTCWSDCGSHCTWGLASCLQTDAQGHCLKLADACDRYCQRACRGGGGPLLPIDTLFPLDF